MTLDWRELIPFFQPTFNPASFDIIEAGEPQDTDFSKVSSSSAWSWSSLPSCLLWSSPVECGLWSGIVEHA